MSKKSKVDKVAIRPKLTNQKFTKRETELIMGTIKKYLAENNLELSDVCRMTSESEKLSSRKRMSIWSDLSQLLPHRTRKAIYQHAIRKFMLKFTKPWTPEEDGLLMQHISMKGKKWAEIGRLLRRLDETCKERFYFLTEKRTNSGMFSVEENVALLRSIQKVTNCTNKSITDIPDNNLPWIDIAQELGYKRSRLDYLRHWSVLRHRLLYGYGYHPLSSNEVETICQQIPTSTKKVTTMIGSKKAMMYANITMLRAKAMTVLDALNEKYGEVMDDDDFDESDIQWAEIDREYGLSYGEARMRWRTLCKECPSKLEFQTLKKVKTSSNDIPITTTSSSSSSSSSSSVSYSTHNSSQFNTHMMKKLSKSTPIGITQDNDDRDKDNDNDKDDNSEENNNSSDDDDDDDDDNEYSDFNHELSFRQKLSYLRNKYHLKHLTTLSSNTTTTSDPSTTTTSNNDDNTDNLDKDVTLNTSARKRKKRKLLDTSTLTEYERIQLNIAIIENLKYIQTIKQQLSSNNGYNNNNDNDNELKSDVLSTCMSSSYQYNHYNNTNHGNNGNNIHIKQEDTTIDYDKIIDNYYDTLKDDIFANDNSEEEEEEEEEEEVLDAYNDSNYSDNKVSSNRKQFKSSKKYTYIHTKNTPNGLKPKKII